MATCAHIYQIFTSTWHIHIYIYTHTYKDAHVRIYKDSHIHSHLQILWVEKVKVKPYLNHISCQIALFGFVLRSMTRWTVAKRGHGVDVTITTQTCRTLSRFDVIQSSAGGTHWHIGRINFGFLISWATRMYPSAMWRHKHFARNQMGVGTGLSDTKFIIYHFKTQNKLPRVIKLQVWLSPLCQIQCGNTKTLAGLFAGLKESKSSKFAN